MDVFALRFIVCTKQNVHTECDWWINGNKDFFFWHGAKLRKIELNPLLLLHIYTIYTYRHNGTKWHKFTTQTNHLFHLSAYSNDHRNVIEIKMAHNKIKRSGQIKRMQQVSTESLACSWVNSVSLTGKSSTGSAAWKYLHGVSLGTTKLSDIQIGKEFKFPA